MACYAYPIVGGISRWRKGENTMQKRLLAILLALVLVLTGLAGCGKQETVMPKATVAKGH